MVKYTFDQQKQIDKMGITNDYFLLKAHTAIANELATQNDLLHEANILKLTQLRVLCNKKDTGVMWEDCLKIINELKKQ